MSISFKEHFEKISTFILAELTENEQIAVSYSAEKSYFLRFNHAKIRQNGTVEQAYVSLTLWKGKKTCSVSHSLTGVVDEDCKTLAHLLSKTRLQIGLLPDDPYQSLPGAGSVSETVYKGRLLCPSDIEKTILDPVQGLDFTGIFTQGTICRGVANSMGAKHWFETENFVLDYSVWLTNGRAIKSAYAGREWNDADYQKKIASAKEGLVILEKPQKKIEKGKYRVYITPDALTEIAPFFSWNGLSERSLQQGESAFLALREGREHFSEQFTLIQDFSLGLGPAFNENGDCAPEKLALIEKGKLVNTLVSARSEKQYGVTSNGADDSEGLLSEVISTGDLAEADAIKALGTGVYVSNFHYLNWSDPSVARITGMTRFACLWVENGEIVAPIADVRWDESLYNIFGANLEAITKESYIFPETGTYGERSVGGRCYPGILVKDFSFTL